MKKMKLNDSVLIEAQERLDIHEMKLRLELQHAIYAKDERERDFHVWMARCQLEAIESILQVVHFHDGYYEFTEEVKVMDES